MHVRKQLYMNINNQQYKHSVFLKYLFKTGKSFNTNISLKSLKVISDL